MITYTRKVEIKYIFKLKCCFHFFLAHFFEIYIVFSSDMSTTRVILPVYSPFNRNIFFSSNHRFWSCNRLLFLLFRRMEIIIVKGIDIVFTIIIFHFRCVRIIKKIRKHVGFTSITKF